MKLGENLRAARLAAGLSQEALGEMLGVVSQTVSKWERGESAPDAALLVPLAEALGLSLDSLFDRTPTDGEMAAGFRAWLRQKTEEERTEAMLRLHQWQLELNLGMTDDSLRFGLGRPEKLRYTWLGKRDLAFHRSSPEGPASFVFREPEAGWDALFEDPERFRALWEALGDRETLRAIRTILSSPAARGIVMREALGPMLGLTQPEKSIPLLTRLNLLYFEPVTVDGEEKEVCFFIPDPAILAILTLAEQLFGLTVGGETWVSGGGWHARPPLYKGEAPASPSFWFINSDIL